jgi:hypothetical protein
MIVCDKSWCFHHLLFQWLNKTYPHPDGRSFNGGLNGMGSQYWARCMEAHVPTSANLILLEAAVNDGPDGGAMHQLALKALKRDNDPAVMVSLLMRETYWASGAEPMHDAVAGYMGLPAVSVRRAVTPHLTFDASKDRQKYPLKYGLDHYNEGKWAKWDGMEDGSHMGKAGE